MTLHFKHIFENSNINFNVYGIYQHDKITLHYKQVCLKNFMKSILMYKKFINMTKLHYIPNNLFLNFKNKSLLIRKYKKIHFILYST